MKVNRIDSSMVYDLIFHLQWSEDFNIKQSQIIREGLSKIFKNNPGTIYIIPEKLLSKIFTEVRQLEREVKRYG